MGPDTETPDRRSIDSWHYTSACQALQSGVLKFCITNELLLMLLGFPLTPLTVHVYQPIFMKAGYPVTNRTGAFSTISQQQDGFDWLIDFCFYNWKKLMLNESDSTAVGDTKITRKIRCSVKKTDANAGCQMTQLKWKIHLLTDWWSQNNQNTS